MKISSIVAALAFVVAPALAVNNFDPCAEKAPEVVAAISQFCTKLGDKSKIPNRKSFCPFTPQPACPSKFSVDLC